MAAYFFVNRRYSQLEGIRTQKLQELSDDMEDSLLGVDEVDPLKGLESPRGPQLNPVSFLSTFTFINGVLLNCFYFGILLF